MEGLYVIAVLAVLIGLLVSIRRDRRRPRKHSETYTPLDASPFDPIGDPGSPETTSHSAHHSDFGCGDTHHTGCDVGGHGGFDGGHGGFDGGGHH
jgi:hypothetical protein